MSRPTVILFTVVAYLLASGPALSQQPAKAGRKPAQPKGAAGDAPPITPPRAARPKGAEPPAAPREFRAAWVASVQNAQWPSKPGLPVARQKQEMLDILDRCAALRLNAVIFQVRPCADALYPSTLEPWSEYLTGTQGKAPEPMWDPLQTWIDEAHARGLELHAWFNPYRVKHVSSKSPHIAEDSIARKQAGVVRKYGGYLWMDPGEPAAARQTLDVIADLVRRYDVDGVHTDDYYYPYKVRDKDGKEVDFPDAESFQRYRDAGGTLERADWRRDNVNRLVQDIYKTTREIKPWVKVGYAPFGIWKSGVPQGIVGLSQYDALYADAKLWLNNGWLDYMSPQLYWKIGGPQDFDKLLTWWAAENTQGRHVWPGMSVARHPVEEVLNQVALTRQAKGTSSGSLIWSVKSVLERPELYEALQQGPFAEAALVPASPWLDSAPPSAPTVEARKNQNGSVALTMKPGEGEAPAVYAVWARREGEWTFSVVPAATASTILEPGTSKKPVTTVVVTAVDRTGNESTRVTVSVNGPETSTTSSRK